MPPFIQEVQPFVPFVFPFFSMSIHPLISFHFVSASGDFSRTYSTANHKRNAASSTPSSHSSRQFPHSQTVHIEKAAWYCPGGVRGCNMVAWRLWLSCCYCGESERSASKILCQEEPKWYCVAGQALCSTFFNISSCENCKYGIDCSICILGKHNLRLVVISICNVK